MDSRSRAIIGADQRRVAIDVALSNGVTRDQYRTVIDLVKTRFAPRYGDWPAARVMAVKRQFREGAITGTNVNAAIRYLRTCAVDGTVYAATHTQIIDMMRVLIRLRKQDDTLNAIQRHHLDFAAQHLAAIMADDD